MLGFLPGHAPTFQRTIAQMLRLDMTRWHLESVAAKLPRISRVLGFPCENAIMASGTSEKRRRHERSCTKKLAQTIEMGGVGWSPPKVLSQASKLHPGVPRMRLVDKGARL